MNIVNTKKYQEWTKTLWISAFLDVSLELPPPDCLKNLIYSEEAILFFQKTVTG